MTTPGFPTEPLVKAPGFELQDRAGPGAGGVGYPTPAGGPVMREQETPCCGQGSSGPIPHTWTPTWSPAVGAFLPLLPRPEPSSERQCC